MTRSDAPGDDVAETSEGSSLDARVAEVVERYLDALRAGGAPDRETFLAQHGDIADRVRTALVGFDFIGRAETEVAEVAAAGPARSRETLGDFRIVREVGRGGMGVVYEAEQLSLGRRVALKVLPFAAVLDDRQLRRFKHEAQAAAFLHHTNIVPVYSVGAERGVHYYAMEFVEGQTLAAVIEELREARRTSREAAGSRRRPPRPPSSGDGPPSSAEARALTSGGGADTPDHCRAVARLGLQAAEALDHAHEQGVVHRDIKPANLMLDAVGHLWVTDFGLARSRANPNLTATGAIVGTLGYMSPEQALGRGVAADPRSDVYSLGVTLLETLTLEPVFPGDATQVLHDIVNRDPVAPRRANPAVPLALEMILLEAVAKDPEARFATAREMADDLRRFLANEPIRARRAPLLDRAMVWARRHRSFVVAASCVLAIGVAALVADSVRRAAVLRDVGEARDRAQKSAERAEANLAKAREAIDRMLTRVGSQGLTGVPGFETVRRALLEDAARLYDDLLASSGDDPQVVLDAARAFHLLAERHGSLGDLAAAEALLDRSRAMLSRLAPEDGRWHPALPALARVERYRGLIVYLRGRPAEALPVLEHAVALADRNARDQPDLAPWGLVAALQTQGDRLAAMGHRVTAESVLRRAIAVGEASRERWPDHPDLRASLTHAYGTLAGLLGNAGERVEAERFWRRAVEESEEDLRRAADSEGFQGAVGARAALAEHLLEEHRVGDAVPLLRSVAEARVRKATEFPRYPSYATGAMRSTGMLAVALFRAGEESLGKETLGDALARFDRLHSDFVEATTARAVAASALVGIAEALVFAGRPVEADEAYRRAVDSLRALVRAAPGQSELHHRLAQVLCNWAQHAPTLEEEVGLGVAREAVAAAQEATRLPDALPAYGETLGEAWWQLGQRLNLSGDPAGAETALRRAVEAKRECVDREGGSPGAREALANCLSDWGERLVKLGRLDEGERAVRESVEILRAPEVTGPDHDEILGRTLCVLSRVEESRGRSAEAEESMREAIDLIRKAVAECPSAERSRILLADAWHRLGTLLLQTGRTLDAAASYREGAQILSASTTSLARARLQGARCEAARALLAAGRVEEAEREYRMAIETAPDSPAEASEDSRIAVGQAWTVLGQIYRDTGRARESIEALERALQWWPWPFRRDALGMLLIYHLIDGRDPSLRDPTRAVEIARDALAHAEAVNRATGKANPRWEAVALRPVDAWSLLAHALTCDERWEDSLAAFARARELGIEEWGIDWVYQGLAHARLGQWEEARRLHALAEQYFRDHPDEAKDEGVARRMAEVATLLNAAPPR
jgi:hypothetical protein